MTERDISMPHARARAVAAWSLILWVVQGFSTITLGAGPEIAAAPDVAAPPFRVRLGDPMTAGAVQAALTGASRRLARPECARVLSDFSDGAGRTLRQNLDALGFEASQYLRFVVFTDGSVQGSCGGGRGTLAFTAPGSRVVFVCPQFREEQWQRPVRAEALLIHETLHTLGLYENPPSSNAITKQVIARCGRDES